MVQKIRPRVVIWVLSSPPHAGHLSEKKTTELSSMKIVHALDNIIEWEL